MYDGDQSLIKGDRKDQDFQRDIHKLSAHWEGFSDPHTGVVDYNWAIGTCPGCRDVMEPQSVGLQTSKSIEVL